jgi:hypothetical protein
LNETDVLRLTNLEGKPFFVRLTAITAVREPNPGEFEHEAKAVVEVGAKAFAVKESVASLALTLGAG